MDDDDELEGNSPTSMWRRNRKRKDYDDEEDEEDDDEESEEDDEEDEEEDDEEEEDHKHITNAEYKGKLRPPPVPIAVVKVVPPPTKMKQTARMSTGGKILRHNLASKNPVSNLSRREYMKVPTKDLP